MSKIKYCKLNSKVQKNKNIQSIVGEDYITDYQSRMQESRKIAIERHTTFVKAEDIILSEKTTQEDSRLHLVVGEDIPQNVPNEFYMVSLYVRDKDNNLNLYADISLPYLINHSEFLNIKGDPRYIFKEGYDTETKGCKYICEIKPLGDLKGIYRVLNGQYIKIQSIDPLCELETNIKPHTLVKKK